MKPHALREPRVLVARPRRGAAGLFVLASLWNALGAVWSSAVGPLFVVVAASASVAFAFLAWRATADVEVRLDDGRLVVRVRGLRPGSWKTPEVELPLASIEAFVVGADDQYEGEGHAVFALLRGSTARTRLPLPLAGVVLRSRGAKRPFAGGVTHAEAARVADTLERMLDDALRDAPTYRAMGSIIRAALPASREERAAR